jgi:hypothetical protein
MYIENIYFQATNISFFFANMRNLELLSKNISSIRSCVKKNLSNSSDLLKYFATELNPIVYVYMKQSANILERIRV